MIYTFLYKRILRRKYEESETNGLVKMELVVPHLREFAQQNM